VSGATIVEVKRGFNFNKFEVFKSNDFAKLYAWRFAKGVFVHHHQAVVFTFFGDKKETRMHTLCVPS